MAATPGTTIGGAYRLDAPIGEGGFGAVWRAHDLRLGRPVALKLLLPELIGDGQVSVRFVREAELVRALHHPNTVRLLDFGREDDGSPFLVYELLHGESLDQLLQREGALAADRVQRIGVQVLKSLLEAHHAGIVHRDVKPANIFLASYDGERDFVKVLDFGIATAPASQLTKLTDAGRTLGTPSYMAPEQLRGEQVGPQVDQYALGLVLAEALAGEVVVRADTTALIFMEHLSDRAVPLPERVRSSVLGPVIERATQKTAARRYPSAAEMLAALEQATNPVHAPRVHAPMAYAETQVGAAVLQPTAPGAPTAAQPFTPLAWQPVHGVVGQREPKPVRSGPSGAVIALGAVAVLATLVAIVAVAVSAGSSGAPERDTPPAAPPVSDFDEQARKLREESERQRKAAEAEFDRARREIESKQPRIDEFGLPRPAEPTPPTPPTPPTAAGPPSPPRTCVKGDPLCDFL
jgi:protein kinase-like protein